MKPLLPIVFGLSLFWVSCDPGELLENQAPETSFFIDQVDLSEDDRLNTVVKVAWLGNDPDGYVKGYELSVQEGPWVFTTSTDSVLSLDLDPGSSTTDVLLKVRAIDNQDLKDDTPAELVLPIRNTPPTIEFDDSPALPDTVRSVFSFTWSIADLEGLGTIDTVFLRVNDGAWYPLDPLENFATIVPQDPFLVGTQEGRLLLGPDAIEAFLPISGLKVGAENILQLQARDISGSFSEVDSSREFYLAPQTSDLLVINSHQQEAAISFTRTTFESISAGSYDWLNVRDELPSFWEPTFSLFIQLYDRIYWFDGGQPIASSGETYLLEQAANSFQNYLNQGRKLMVSTPFNPVFNEPARQAQSLIFDFSPADSLSSSSGQARIGTGARVFGVGDWGNIDTLRAGRFLTGVDPFYPKNPSDVLMEAEIIAVSGWIGPSVVAARSRFINNEINQVFFSIEIHQLNQSPAALEGLFDRVFNREFDW